MAPVTEHTAELDGQPVFTLEAPPPAGSEGRAPVVYLHGNPTCADDWRPFLERTGGIAPDLLGFGRSGKRGDLDLSMDGLGRWVTRLLDSRGLDRVRLVVHDWGAVGLLAAIARPERIERLVVLNAVPFLPGYRWHLWGRLWRTRGVGEVVVGATSLVLTSPFGPRLPDRRLAGRLFDQGTQRAVLRLYRSADPELLAERGRGLGAIGCPALVLWGDQDPYIDPRFADGYAAALGDATAEHLPDAGHWPWIDRPDVVGRVAEFLDG